MSALHKLTVAHLRGSTQPFSLSFEAGKKLTVVYGENGSGKSPCAMPSILLGNGTVGSLENRGLGNALSKYWASRGRDAYRNLCRTGNCQRHAYCPTGQVECRH